MHQLHVPTKQLLSDWKKIRFSNKQNLNSQHDRASFPKSRFAWRVAKTWKAFAKSDFTPECSHFSAATHHVYFAQVDHLVCAFFGNVRASCEKTIFPFSLFRKRSCTLRSFSVLFFFSLLFRFFSVSSGWRRQVMVYHCERFGGCRHSWKRHCYHFARGRRFRKVGSHQWRTEVWIFLCNEFVIRRWRVNWGNIRFIM